MVVVDLGFVQLSRVQRCVMRQDEKRNERVQDFIPPLSKTVQKYVPIRKLNFSIKREDKRTRIVAITPLQPIITAALLDRASKGKEGRKQVTFEKPTGHRRTRENKKFSCHENFVCSNERRDGTLFARVAPLHRRDPLRPRRHKFFPVNSIRIKPRPSFTEIHGAELTRGFRCDTLPSL